MPFACDNEPNAFDLNAPGTFEAIDNTKAPFPPGSEYADRRIKIWTCGWNFTGRPLLDRGSLGNLEVELVVEEIDELPINCSLFRRDDMLRYAKGLFSEDWLASCHLGYKEERDPFDLTKYRWRDHLAPLNNQWLARNGSHWLYFEAQSLHIRSDEFYWLCPIGHRRCLRATFSVSRWLSNTSNAYRKQRSPITNYRELMEKIMSTITVQLSEAARQEQASIANPEGHYPLFQCTKTEVEQAKHILYMWSDKGYRDKSKPKDADHRAPKEEVAAFVEERIQPRPLPGCLAIGPAHLPGDNTGVPTNASPSQLPTEGCQAESK
ncbi:hypothetical protein ACNKU7_01395 [Microbulbifer sp. SA54]|uniref:hypothetical protein n=1 Tax=Microbulbifer sp. SA54 TaxID=3401577 RepID=UPI003AAACBB7